MKIIEFNYNEAQKCPEDIALCLGFFDAIHLGHQNLLKEAQKSGYKVAVMTFDNPPIFVLKKVDRNLGLTSNADKAEYFAELGVDYLFILHIDEELMSLTRYEFIDLVLKKINPKIIVCGEDYTFGKDALGNPTYLEQYFKVNSVPLSYDGDMKVSSREIAKLLKDHEIKRVNYLLNRNYRVCGLVKRGNRIGRSLGFPTANIDLDFPYILPAEGVYMGYAVYEEERYKAIISIGTHPTILPLAKPILEVHIIDFDKDIYNELLFVEFVDFMRDNVRFINTDELKEQLKKDRLKAKKVLQ